MRDRWEAQGHPWLPGEFDATWLCIYLVGQQRQEDLRDSDLKETCFLYGGQREIRLVS